MIYPLAGIVLGIIVGAVRAKMRGGKVLDMIQWAAVFAMIFGIIGLFIVIGIDRSYQG
ncbi:hypothetical protein HCZ30_11805 [Marivivens donghaensis]|uniref:Apolipoprotein acyltransferase n=1 Tax=Marivivens donghaensis TaxID=1699413 RepID=A0ABX0VZ70_9RHOB|nr:hypothetical protein [Marivivens donghaensis]NIY73114.1 hypothetical protein [Marivivens donghaensis]